MANRHGRRKECFSLVIFILLQAIQRDIDGRAIVQEIHNDIDSSCRQLKKTSPFLSHDRC